MPKRKKNSNSTINNESDGETPTKKKQKNEKKEKKADFAQNQQSNAIKQPIQAKKAPSQQSQQKTKPPEAPVQSEVSKFLDSLDLSQFSDKFESESIEMDILGLLSESDWGKLGLNMNQRKKIIGALENRKPKKKLELNWSDAKAFLESLNDITKQNGFKLKKDFAVPHNTLLPTDNSLKFCPVESTEREFWTQVAHCLPQKGTNDRYGHPMFALWAGPGLGKTWTLNHLASMTRGRIDSVINKYNDEQKMKKKRLAPSIDCPFVFVQIDFNGSSSFEESESDDPLMALDMRFFFSAFFDQSTSFDDIHAAFSFTFADESVFVRLEKLVQFFKTILDEQKKDQYQIVIAIDEISRLESTKATTQDLLDRCNHIMNVQNYLWVVASALENDALACIRHGTKSNFISGRPIAFFSPHKPTMSERLHLFKDYHQHGTDLELLLLYSGGHWRTLEVINSKLHRHWTMSELPIVVNAPLLINSDQFSLETWAKIISLTLKANKVSSEFELEPIRKTVLKGEDVFIPAVTIENAVARAPLLNSISELHPYLVPRLSVLQLTTWLREVQMRKGHSLYEPLKLVLDEYDMLASKTYGHGFERFHALWEVLQNRLESPTPLSLVRNVYFHMQQALDEQFFKRPNLTKEQLDHFQKIVVKLMNFCDQKFVSVSKKMSDLKKKIEPQLNQFQLRNVKNDYALINKLIDEDEESRNIPKNHTQKRMTLWNDSIRFKSVFLLPKNYPDIDIVSFFKSESGKVFALIEQLQSRYSPNTSKLEFDDISERSKALASFEMLFPNHGIPASHILFAVIAWKNIDPEVAVNLICPTQTQLKREDAFPDGYHVDIVAGIPELRKSYGPTLESVGWLLGEEPTNPLFAGSFVITQANE